MDGYTQFIISICDFQSEEERFREFVSINSNTPLPEYYKAITNYDGYCKVIATQIFRELKERYPDLVRQEVYFIQRKDENDIYAALRRVNVPMHGNIPEIVRQFMELSYCKKLFPAINSRYPTPYVNPDKCKAQRSKDKLEQCPNPKGDGDYCTQYHRTCGQSGSTCKLFSPRTLLSAKYGERKEVGGLFLLDPKWAELIIEHMYPPTLI
jgi:hypothetical protein